MNKTKVEAVAEALETAGAKGVHSFDLIKQGGLRAAARVNDLKKMGYQICAVPEKKGTAWGVRYSLKEE